ncbi:hypothetical protein ABT247_11410 [Kitasatospora sp. NPDC001539]|uniref:hypothetical protein n=1 Tax=Kitasatospora sp. NPDC001539 TaxID=3154384 RepID=UPI0033285037
MTITVSARSAGGAGLAAAAALALVLAAGTAAGAAARGSDGPVAYGPVAYGLVAYEPPAYEPAAAGAALSPGGPKAPPRAVAITEGEVGEVGLRGTITYPSVTSCLVVTVRLRDGAKVGGHASLFQVPGKYASDEILPAMRRAVGHRPVQSVDVSGAVGAWNPSYFHAAIERYTDGSAPAPTADAGGIGAAVAELLGLPAEKITVRDVPDGDITR